MCPVGKHFQNVGPVLLAKGMGLGLAFRQTFLAHQDNEQTQKVDLHSAIPHCQRQGRCCCEQITFINTGPCVKSHASKDLPSMERLSKPQV